MDISVFIFMEVIIQSSKLVKPSYDGDAHSTEHHVRLTVFDRVTCDEQVAVIYAFNSPTLSNIAIEKGLSKVLVEYRDFAGSLGKDADGNPVIFLDDHGVRFVQATVDSELRTVLPSRPTKEIQSLHPSLYEAEELTQVQLTRFACGSLVIGFTAHHQIADGYDKSKFLVAWGLATRGFAIDPLPLHTRDAFSFRPRDPPLIQYDHQNIEYIKTVPRNATGKESNEEEIVTHKAHFSKEFITKLRTSASAGLSKPYTRFETILAHLWRVITKARGLHGHETTHIQISVNGRMRMDPKVPNEFFGNLVLWAYPRCKLRDLIEQPLSYAAQLIHEAVLKVNDSYFKSFIDFASSDIISREGLVKTADINEPIDNPNLEVESWLTFPFYDLDFGSGRPFYFMPTYFPIEGLLFFLPSYFGDSSIDAIVALYANNVDAFKMHCYSLDLEC